MNFISTIPGGKIAALLLAALPGLTQAAVFTADAMRKDMRDAAVTGAFEPLRLDAMRNEHEAFQVIFQAADQPLTGARVTVGGLRSADGTEIPAEAFTLRRAHYILCDKHVKHPGWYPDALPLYDGKAFDVSPGQLQSIFVDVAIPVETPPGEYTGTITATEAGNELSTSLTIRVRDITLPETPSFQSAFPIWGKAQLTAPYPGMTEDSLEYRALLERFYWFMVGYRLPPDDIPVPLDAPEAERYLRHPAVNSFRIPYDPNQPERFQALCTSLRDKGLLERGYVYTLDEPARDQYGMCAAYADRIHELVPDVRFLLTVNNGKSPALEKHVDIWCPLLVGYDPNYFHALQAAGDNVWWYTCVAPQQPYPTYLINDDAVSPRMLSWLQAKYRVEGVLYWALNIWQKWNPVLERYEARDIWNDPLAFPAANGDGYLVYPGPTPQDDPVPSWRLEMIRQGNEDFDMLTLLREATTRTALRLGRPDYTGDVRVAELVNRIARSLVQFDHDPASLSAARRDVLDEIEALTAGPQAILEASAPEGEVITGTPVRWTLTVEADAAVEVNSIVDGRAQAIVPERQGDVYTWEFPLHEATRLKVTVAKAGKKAVFCREYQAKVYAGKELEVFNWGMDAVAERLVYDHASSRALPGSVIREFVFDINADFPNVRLKLTGDTSEYRWIVIRAANYGRDENSAYLKFHGPAGALDGAQLQIPAGGVPVTLAFPFNAADATAADAFDTLEFWMFKNRPVNTLVIESITLFTDRPQADNVY